MSWIATAVVASTAVTAYGGYKASKAAGDAADTAAEGEQRSLDYLMAQEEMPTYYRDQAMMDMGELYGFGAPPQGQPQGQSAGGPQGGAFSKIMGQIKGSEGMPSGEVMPDFPSREEGGALARLQSSPMFRAMMESIPAAEESILRHQSVTGVRGGDTSQLLAQNTIDTRNQALMQGMQGLRGFMSPSTQTGNIANRMSNIGMIQGQGITAQGQAQQQTMGNLAGIGMSGLGLHLQYSDIRLKENIDHIGTKEGHNIYNWDWSEYAKDLGLEGSETGVMAHEIAETNPEAICTADGYLIVDYKVLGLN